MRCEIELPTDKIEWQIGGEGSKKLSEVYKDKRGKVLRREIKKFLRINKRRMFQLSTKLEVKIKLFYYC